MRICRLGWLVLFVFCCAIAPTFAQVRSSLVSDSDARRYGLTREWYTQVALDGANGRLKHLTQFVSHKQTYTVFEVSYATGREYISERDMDRFGDVLNRDGAQKQAEQRVADLKKQGINAKAAARLVPEITLVATTDRGTVHVIDGHTGRTLWSAMFGDSTFPTMQAAVNDKYVSIVNGSTLYLATRDIGKSVWQRKLGGAPGAGAALSEKYAFVPLVNGMMEIYTLDDSHKPPSAFKSHGRPLIQPTITSVNVVWPTDKGYMYVARNSEVSLRFRLEADDTITAPVSFRDPVFLYTASHDGYVYCVHQRAGDVAWRFSTGDIISQEVLPVEDALFVVTDSHALYRLNSNTGDQDWYTSGITQILGASDKRLYALGNTGRLMILDMKTGGLIGSLPSVTTDLKFLNTQTDRIFVATSSGMVQCLREVDLQLPVIHNYYSEASATGELTAKPVKKKPAAAAAAPPGEAMPMGAAADPFGGGDAAPKAKAAEAVDPFAPMPAGGAMKAEEKPKPAVPDPFGG